MPRKSKYSCWNSMRKLKKIYAIYFCTVKEAKILFDIFGEIIIIEGLLIQNCWHSHKMSCGFQPNSIFNSFNSLGYFSPYQCFFCSTSSSAKLRFQLPMSSIKLKIWKKNTSLKLCDIKPRHVRSFLNCVEHHLWYTVL